MLLAINTENWIWLILSILIVWRITTFVCYDTGPLNIMLTIRRLLYQMKIGKLIECFHCASVWISIVLTFLIYHPGVTTIFLAIAIAGGASIIEKIVSYYSQSQQSIDETE